MTNIPEESPEYWEESNPNNFRRSALYIVAGMALLAFVLLVSIGGSLILGKGDEDCGVLCLQATEISGTNFMIQTDVGAAGGINPIFQTATAAARPLPDTASEAADALVETAQFGADGVIWFVIYLLPLLALLAVLAWVLYRYVLPFVEARANRPPPS